MKYMAIIDADEKPVSCEFIGCNGNAAPYLVGATTNIKVLEQESKARHCKDCKYFEYDSVANVDGIPLIVAHEICSRWGDGCKTREDGYCFLFEPQKSEDKE